MRQGFVELFADLFTGRANAWGDCTQNPPRAVRSPVTDRNYREHLVDGPPIGIYPMWPYDGDWLCRWGCVDFDEGYEASWPHAVALHRMLRALGLHPWVEKSRSKGYHVWVFAVEDVPARTMRRALLTACQAAQVPTKEVNPKSEGFEQTDALGNFVRLPYPKQRGITKQQVYRSAHVEGAAIDPFNSVEEFVHSAWECRDAASQLELVARAYQPPKRSIVVFDEPDEEAAHLAKKLGGLAYTIWRDGPLDTSDRSSVLFRFACKLAEDGTVDAGEALVLLRDFDDRFTRKFHDRPDGDRRYESMIETAYGTYA